MKKRLYKGGTTTWPPKPIDQITYTQPELYPATTKNLNDYSNSIIKIIDNKYNIANNLEVKRGDINYINKLATLGNLTKDQTDTLYGIALNESKINNIKRKDGRDYPLFGDIDFGKDSFTTNTGNRDLDRINFIKAKTKNFTNLNKYNPRHLENFGEDYTTRIARMKDIINTNPQLLDSIGIKKFNKGGQMKNTLRINNRLNPPKRAIGGIISAATGLYNMGQQLGQTMLNANTNEYGLIDDNSRHANTMQANMIFDPVGHAAKVFGTGGSWEDLGWWGGQREAAQADKDLAKIKAEEADSKRIAGLQMGKYGASTYEQYGIPGYNQYKGGGWIGKAITRMKQKGTIGSFSSAAKRHGMSTSAFASKVMAHKGNYSSSMVKKANFAKNVSRAEGGPVNRLSKSDAYWLAVHGSPENAGKDAGMWKDVFKEIYGKPLNPERIFAVDAMPGQRVANEFITTNKFPKVKKPFGFNLTKDGFKILGKSASKFLGALVPGAEDMPIIPSMMPNYNTLPNRMGIKNGGMIPVKLDNNEIVYDQFGNPAPIKTNSPIGIKAGGTFIKGGKGKTDGINAMLPPNAIVISNDNGEVNKLTNEFEYNPSKQVIRKYMNRAIIKQPKSTKGLYGGGNPWDFYNSPMMITNYNKNMLQQTATPNIGGQSYNNIYGTDMQAKVYPPVMSTYNNFWTNKDERNYQNQNKELMSGLDTLPGLQRDINQSNRGSAIGGTNPDTKQDFKSFVSNPNTWQAVSSIGELGLGVANTVLNVRAMNKLKKLKFPDYTPGRFYEQDPRYMKGYFNEAKTGVDESNLNTLEFLRRNTPSSSLIGSTSKLNANALRSKSGISAQESGTIGDIMNQNSRGKTAFSMEEAQKYMGYKGAKLAHKIGLIQTGVNLNQNTINTLQGFTRNLGQNAYQARQLAAYADMNMLPDYLPGETTPEYRRRVFGINFAPTKK